MKAIDVVQVTAITRCTPVLQELHACTNQISSLE